MQFIQIGFLITALACLAPWISSGFALALGCFFALVLGNPFLSRTQKLAGPLLQWSVVGMGAGMNLEVVLRAGASGFGYTALGVVLTIAVGLGLGRILGTPRDTSLLLSVGTAICGGSAIAAVAPTVRAKSQEISVAMGTVFILNAVALFIFPPIGHWIPLDQVQFGLWSALAIHDTSSVVGTASQYGSQALEIATTVKLARALWIIPTTLVVGLIWDRLALKEGNNGSGRASKRKLPWFILGFLAMAAWVTWVPSFKEFGVLVSAAARRALVLTLFLIGANLSKDSLKKVGFRPLIQGVSLWLLSATISLVAIYLGWIGL